MTLRSPEAAIGGGTQTLEVRRRAELQADERAWPETDSLSAEDIREVLHELRVRQIELEMQNDELQRAHLAVEALRSRYFDLYDFAPVGYISLTNEGLILDANLRFSILVGVPKAELLNLPLSRFIWSDDQDIYHLNRKKLLAAGERQAFHLRMKGGDGCPFWARLEAACAGREDDDACFRLTCTDISEQRMVEERLAQTNRMESMGLLAAGIAHEVNNPLTAVVYNIETLAEQLPAVGGAVTRICRGLQEELGDNAIADAAGQDGAELVQESNLAHLGDLATQAATAAHRAHEVVKGLTSFARPQETELTAVDVNVAARDAIAITDNQVKYRAKLLVDLGPLPRVFGDVGRIAQVLVNLLVNAALAIEAGDAEGNRITVRTWSEGDRVLVEVSDTGCGISPTNMGSVFEPFFTTRSPERGTGLGLAISKRIITDLGGNIEVQSTVNQGTRVVFWLKALREAAEPLSSPAARAASVVSVARGRILVVDDEEIVRSVISSMLRREHEILTVDSGRAAREIIGRDQRFDLILCDLMMADVSGIELHAWLVDTYPELAHRFAFITGGVFTPHTEEYLARISNTVIQKPFDVARLRKIVGDHLAAARGLVR